MAHLTLALLGPLQIVRDGVPLAGFESDKVRALLIYLAVEHERPQRRGMVAELFWPERPERSALLNLNQALANLRRTLGDREASTPFILATRDSLQFNPAADYAIDVVEFRSLLAACEAHKHRSVESCAPCAERRERATALYRGAFLDQFTLRNSSAFDEWALVLREQFQRQAIDAFADLAVYYERRGNLERAIRVLQRQIVIDPWGETAHRQLMGLLAADQQRSAALAHYVRLCDLLATDLGIEPEAETTALYEQIRDEEADFRPEAAAIQQSSPSIHSSSLPAMPTPFIGRTGELAQLGERLNDPGSRLISIVGLGGSGKTRLALEAAARYAAAFRDGVHFVGLAGVSSPDLVLPMLAQSLGLTPDAGQGAIGLTSALRGRELLLVLDNLEQLRDGAGQLGELLQGVPGLTILATSRERLQLRGEWSLQLSGLDLPTSHTPEALEQSSAGALFIQATQRICDTFEPNDADRRAITHICRALAGHPLAIELAAAWVQLLSCAEIERELTKNLDLLNSPLADLPERHRTLRAVLDGAWSLLNADEQRALQRLACFRGSFDREAAVAMLANAITSSGHHVVLSLLGTLAARTLLRRTPDGRYELHEFVRQYAEQQLAASGEIEATWTEHRAYYLALVESAEPHLKGAEQATWLERLAQEQDNLRVALERASIQGAIEEAGRMCVVLRWFWYLRGNTGEGWRWMEQVLATPEKLTHQLLARLQHGAGVLAEEQGAYAAAAARYAAALALFRDLDDLQGVRITTNSIGVLSLAQGDYQKAQACYEESLRLSHLLGSEIGIANSLNNLGNVAHVQGQSTLALTYLEEALARGRALQHDLLINTALANIGDAARTVGDFERAVAAYSEALALQRASGYTRGAALSLYGLGATALAQGDLDTAASDLFEALGLAWPESSPREVIAILEELAAWYVARNEYQEAARLAGMTSAIREQLLAPRLAHEQETFEQTVSPARTALGPTAFAAAYGIGRATSLEQAVTELLHKRS